MVLEEIVETTGAAIATSFITNMCYAAFYKRPLKYKLTYSLRQSGETGKEVFLTESVAFLYRKLFKLEPSVFGKSVLTNAIFNRKHKPFLWQSLKDALNAKIIEKIY